MFQFVPSSITSPETSQLTWLKSNTACIKQSVKSVSTALKTHTLTDVSHPGDEHLMLQQQYETFINASVRSFCRSTLV